MVLVLTGGCCVRTFAGVDPLASSKGFWAEVLGVGNFFFELGVQIVDVCMSTRATNGGLIDVEASGCVDGRVRALLTHTAAGACAQDLLKRLKAMRGSKADAVSLDDIDRAIKKLAILGNGFQMLRVGWVPSPQPRVSSCGNGGAAVVTQVGHRNIVVSVPHEMSTDSQVVLEAAEVCVLQLSCSWCRPLLRRHASRAVRCALCHSRMICAGHWIRLCQFDARVAPLGRRSLRARGHSAAAGGHVLDRHAGPGNTVLVPVVLPRVSSTIYVL
jgi:hypothetical protein